MIQMKTPVVEMLGDEMTRVMWEWVKDELIRPFVELKTEVYDLGLKNRDADPNIPREAAAAIGKWGVGVKCATITANAARVKEYGLKGLSPSPNAIIRGVLMGTVFREPILVKNVPPIIASWRHPIIIARHASGDIYEAVEAECDSARLCVEHGGVEESKSITSEPSVCRGMSNAVSSIREFAHSCFSYAESKNMPLWFSAKDTISKVYDGRFKSIFEEVHKEYPAVDYFYTLIDDAVARVVRSSGGFIWALKNYDGDVMSDMIASIYGSLAMMTSVCVGKSGWEFEASHGTVQKHYYHHLKGEKTSTNPTALIFAWTGALNRRATIDGTPELAAFSKRLERATVETIESGCVTGDLARITGDNPVDTQTFIQAIKERLN